MTEEKPQTLVHMGRLVRHKAREKGLNATSLSPLLGMSAGSVSYVFRRQALHSTLLLHLCNVLDYDFFAHLCQCPKEPPVETKKYEVRISKLEKENEALQEKIAMLEEMNELLKAKR